MTKDEDYSSDDASSKVFQHNLGDYPVPKPRLKTQMMKKEDGDSEAPPLPPRRYRQSDYRSVVLITFSSANNVMF